MTAPETTAEDTAGYIHLLEGLVAVVAIKAGLNPNTLMSNALQSVSEASGINSEVTQQFIEQRWQGRDLQAGAIAAKTFELPVTASATPVTSQTVEPVPMAQRYAEYRDRQSEAQTED